MFWVWLILAAVLITGEIFTAGFFLLWFGIAAAAAAVAALLGAGDVLQWVIFVGLSFLLWASTRPLARRMLRNTATEPVGAERYRGAKGIVIQEIDNAQAKGMVRVEREEWRAESQDGSVIPEGTWVEVVDLTGARLVVKPSDPERKGESE
jgi:membrane protein implicated in regulation of membrane protease activity